MNNKIYTQIQSRMNTLEKNRNSAIDSLKAKLNGYVADFKNASLHTTANADAETFVKAIEDKEHAKHFIDYYTECIKRVESESLFTDEEYNSNVNAIRSEQKKITDASFKKVVKTLNELFSIYDELDEDIRAFNDLIRELNLASHKPDKVVVFHDNKYDFIDSHVGQLEGELAVLPAFREYFSDHK